MKDVTLNGKPVSPRNESPLISRSAILILSSVLIGTALGNGTFSGIYIYCFSAGTIGLISFLGLDYLAEHRARQSVHRDLARAHEKISARIERHVFAVDRVPLEGPKPKPRRESSWLTVNVSRS